MYLLYGLLALGVAVGVVALLIIFSLLALARKGEAHLERLESCSREKGRRQGAPDSSGRRARQREPLGFPLNNNKLYDYGWRWRY
jgi:hypothetical protein